MDASADEKREKNGKSFIERAVVFEAVTTQVEMTPRMRLWQSSEDVVMMLTKTKLVRVIYIGYIHCPHVEYF